jgi:hypothetical protein
MSCEPIGELPENRNPVLDAIRESRGPASKQRRIEMKKLIMALAIIGAAFGQKAFAQTDTSSVFKNVIASYLELKNALTNDDGDSAAVAAEKLFAALNEMSGDNLPSQHETWTKYHQKLSRETMQIKNAGNIDAQREQFKKVSANMYAVLKSLQGNNTELFYDYCPMAKGYWISETSAIVNPYLGQSMPTCGSITDTLATHK